MLSENVFFCNYSIGEDSYKEVSKVCKIYGKRILLIGGKKAMEAGRERLNQALEDSKLEIVDAVLYGNDCTAGTIVRLAEYGKTLNVDMIFGMGGGKALDTAKGVAHRMELPIFTFPTIAATCAATTALSVVYREDGSFEKFWFYDRPANHCFIDLEIIANAPDRYLQAGVGETFAVAPVTLIVYKQIELNYHIAIYS